MTGPLRRRMRDKALRAVDEVVDRHHAQQREEMDRRFEGLRTQLTAELREEVRRALLDAEMRARRDLAAAAEREAVASTARFLAEAMPTAPHFPHPHATLEHALALPLPDGLALEFGVYTGTTLKIIATALPGRLVAGFDSFEGLPEDWRTGFPAGTFDLDGLPDVDGADLVVGWFEDTLPPFLAEHPGPVAFLHLDSDLYSSTRTVLDHVGPRLVPGSVIVFDEYFNYPGWERHEHRAWLEYVARTGTKFSYLGYTRDNEQVVVRVDAT